jgi:hypothetical protein
MAKATEKTEDQSETKEKELNVSPSLTGEIDAGVESAMEEVERDRAERDAEIERSSTPAASHKDDLPPVKDRTGDDKPGSESPDIGKEDDDKSKKDSEEDVITDVLLERAVKAVISLEEAKQYPNASLLGHVCDRLESLSEKNAGADKKESSKDEAGNDGGNKDPLAAIPDFDPDEYDENVVAGFKALKDIVRQQQETINGLKTSGKNDEKSWFDSKVSGLGESFDKALETAPEKRAALKEQFDILAAGYEAAGKKIDQDTLFSQAVAITLGDVAAQVAMDAKGDQIRKRAGQNISRPGGTRATPSTDAFEDTAAELDRKFFGKK